MRDTAQGNYLNRSKAATASFLAPLFGTVEFERRAIHQPKIDLITETNVQNSTSKVQVHFVQCAQRILKDVRGVFRKKL